MMADVTSNATLNGTADFAILGSNFVWDGNYIANIETSAGQTIRRPHWRT
jgi:hypothetical protein